jgi:hypothetical protein
MSTKKRSARAIRRAELIRGGKCGTCGKRKLAAGHKECRTCLDYYTALAKKARAVQEVKRVKRNAQKAASRKRQS